jgi:hypothetical protein
MIRRKLVALWALCAAPLIAGCFSISSLQTARAVPEGQLRPGLGIDVGIASPPGSSSTSVVLPVPEASLRYGLGGGRDIGAKVSPLGDSFEFKQEVLSTSGIVVSVAPSLGFIYAANSDTGIGTATVSRTLFNVQLPVLLGIEVPGGHELVIGPRIIEGAQVISNSPGGSTTSWGTLLGGSFGFALRTSPSLRVMPEVSFVSKIAGDSPQGGVGVQFGVGFLFGP